MKGAVCCARAPSINSTPSKCPLSKRFFFSKRKLCFVLIMVKLFPSRMWKSTRNNLLSLICVGLYLYTIFWILYFMASIESTDSYSHIPGRKPKFRKQRTEKPSDWQSVTGSNPKHTFNVYSAYSHLARQPSEVLIIGMASDFDYAKAKISCQFYFKDIDRDDDGSRSQTGQWSLMDVKATFVKDPQEFQATVKRLPSKCEEYYSGVFLRCPLPPRSSINNMNPVAVSVTTKNKRRRGAFNFLWIHYLDESKDSQYQYNFSVCVPPLSSFNDGFHFIEWMEFYKLMGVEQFTFYNSSFGPDVSCILKELVNDPIIKVNVHPWNHNPWPDANKISPVDTAVAGLNDCLYKHRGRLSKYVAFVDLNEFIFPTEDHSNSFPDIVNLLDTQNPDELFAEYQFQNGFFLLSRPDDPLLSRRCSHQTGPLGRRVCHQSYLMKKLLREVFNPYGTHSRYLLRPEGVKQISYHVVDVFEKGFESFQVPPTVAYSRHYVDMKGGRSYYPKTDRVPLQVGFHLVENLSRRLEYFGKWCNVEVESNSTNNSV